MRAIHVLLMLWVFLSPFAHAGEQDATDGRNPYSTHYEGRTTTGGIPQEPQVFRGSSKDGDAQSLLERGYDMLGRSEFQDGNVPVEMLTEQARAVGAAMTLVYVSPVAAVPASVKIDQAKKAARSQNPADEESPAPDSPGFRYYATFWEKLPPPLLGVHVQGSAKSASGQTGLSVVAVIRDSPAASAGIHKGDTLLRLADTALDKPESLVETVRRHQGKPVVIRAERDGRALTFEVTLRSMQKTDDR
jgi:hypothetical protein